MIVRSDSHRPRREVTIPARNKLIEINEKLLAVCGVSVEFWAVQFGEVTWTLELGLKTDEA